MVRPPITTVGPASGARVQAVSSGRDRQRFMDDLDEIVVKPAAAGHSRVILLGQRRDARRLVRNLGKKPWSGLHFVGFVDAGHSRSSGLSSRSRPHLALHAQTDPIPVLGGIEQLDELVDRARATDLVVAVRGDRPPQLSPALTHLSKSGVAVHWVLVDSGRLDVGTVGSARTSGATEWHVHSPGRPHRTRHRLKLESRPLVKWHRLTWSRTVKRAIDAGLATCALIVLAPLFAVVAASILATTGRPIFYSQERVGQGGRRFRIVKFRSMRTDAESATGPIWASNHDTRCTRIGDLLRRTNIDELPQLFNVVKGDMSLVGPRPERPNFVTEFRGTIADYDLRHAVPGGMTGWAQVHGWRGRTSLRKRIQYDLDYIERWSIGLDLRIMFMTIQHVLWGKTSWNDSTRMAKRLD
jgi:undecaprenyl-phosphate glucose phosphotransferase